MDIRLDPSRRVAGDAAPIDIGALRAEKARLARRVARSKPPITAFIDVPRVVEAAGRPLVVSQLRLIDLAEMQAFLEDRAGNPVAALPPAWADPDPATRRDRLAVAWTAAESWPPRFGSAEGRRLLHDATGFRFALHLMLRRHQPGLTAEDLAAIAAGITAAEWEHIQRVAWGVGPRAEIVAELVPDRSPATGTDWPELLAGLIKITRYTPEQVENLTVGQLSAILSGGRPAALPPGHAAARHILGLQGRPRP